MPTNFAQAIFRGMDDANQRRLQQQSMERQNRLADLAVSREERADQTDQRSQLAQLARGWKSLTDSTQKKGYYDRFIQPAVSQMGFGDLGPYDEAAVDGVASQILAAYGPGIDQAQVHSAFRGQNGNMWVLDRTGSVRDTGAAFDPNNQIIDTGNGFFGVNKSNLSASPVVVGGQQPPQAPAPGMYQTPQGIVRLGDDLTPEMREAAMADIAAGGNSSQVTLPPRQAPQQLRSAPKPQAPSELERRIQIAQQMGATPEEQRRMVIGGNSARDAQRISAKDATTARQKVTQIQAARNQLRSARQAFEKIRNSFSAGLGGEYLPTPEGQSFDRAVRNLAPLITAVTRVPGVGAMSDYESRLQEASLPSRGTYENVTVQQFQDLENLLNTVEAGYKDLLSGGQEAPTQSDNEASIDDLLDMYR